MSLIERIGIGNRSERRPGLIARSVLAISGLSFCVAITGCANPSYFRRDTQFVPKNWSRIAVLPFSGDQRFTKTAADTLTLHLLEQKSFVIMEPQSVKVAMNKIVAWQDTPNDISIVQAQKVGELVNADATIIGVVTSYNNGMTLNAFVTAKLVDTRTGQVLVASHKPSGLLLGWSEHQCAMAAVKRVAKDLVKALDELAKRNEVSQISGSQEGDGQPLGRLL